MAKLSNSVGITQHPREGLLISGILAAPNATVSVSADGCSTVTLDLRGTFSLTAEVAGTVDGVNWIPIPMRPMNQNNIAYVSSIFGAIPGVWVGKCAPFKLVRVLATVYVSGAATATLLTQNGILDNTTQGLTTPQSLTATAVVGTAVTATLASPGAGLRYYINAIRFTRFATATLTAAAAPVIVTSSNLPGSPAWNFGAEALAQGIADIRTEFYNRPIASSSQNTATSISAPATPNVIWRITIDYYVAP